MNRMSMEPSPSLWEGILRRASGLRRRYRDLEDLPQSTWSLVNRAAQKFKTGGVPDANDRDHAYAAWTRAMYTVLNDLHRRENARGPRAPLEGEPAEADERDGETLGILEEALRALADQDERMGERKAMIIALRHFEGLQWQEIAGALGAPLSTVRREWYLARAWLRRELKRRGVEAP